MMYLPYAIELASEREREVRELVLRRQAARAAAAAPRGPRRPSRLRTLAARPVRALSDASHALSEAAITAATLIEGEAR
jgi:hypothetical protein